MQADHYKILGIEPGATQDDIKKAYREACSKHHPDLNPDNPRAEENFKKACEAYNTLSDPNKRRMYDLGRRIDVDINLDPSKIDPEDIAQTFSQILKDFIGEDKIKTFNDVAEKYEKYKKTQVKKTAKKKPKKNKEPICMECGGKKYRTVKQGMISIKRPCKRCSKT